MAENIFKSIWAPNLYNTHSKTHKGTQSPCISSIITGSCPGDVNLYADATNFNTESPGFIRSLLPECQGIAKLGKLEVPRVQLIGFFSLS